MSHEIITIEFDGGCHPNPGNKYGSFCVSRNDTEFFRRSRVEFGYGTCNEAEFNSLQLALEETIRCILDAGIEPKHYSLVILTDSTIVRNRLISKRRARVFKKHSESSHRMIAHADRCLAIMELFDGYNVIWQGREANVVNFGH